MTLPHTEEAFEPLPFELADGDDRVVIVEAPAGEARRERLESWRRTALADGVEAWRLDLDLDRGGAWAGTRDLLAAVADELLAEAPELVAQHDYELVSVVPELLRRIELRHASLTDQAVGDERVRNYPIDRAYRIVHGLVDLVAAWRRRREGRPWVLLVDSLTTGGALNRRFVRDLLRRGGGQALTLVVAEEPGAGAAAVRQDLERWASIETIAVAAVAGEKAPLVPALAAAAAESLEETTRGKAIEAERSFPELIRLWRAAGRPEKLLRWQVFALGMCNHRGFYEDALHFVPPVLDHLRESSALTPDERWNIVGNIFHSLVTTGSPEAAKRVVEEEAEAKIDDPRYRVRVFYVLAMLHSRYLPQHDLERAEGLLVRALAMLEELDLPEADRHFQSVFAANGLALVRHRQGDPEAAIALCRSGFERLEKHLGDERHKLHRSVLLYNIAQVYQGLRERQSAIHHLTLAIEMDPQYSEYYNDRGSLYLQLGDLPAAIGDYRTAIELSAPYPEVWTNLGQALRQGGRDAEAVAAFDRALDLEPMQPLALVGRAEAHEALGDLERALADYDAALALEPEQPLVLSNRAVLHYGQGRLGHALADLEAAIVLSPATPELYQNRAVALRDLGRPDAAAQDLRRYLQLAPDAADRPEIESLLAGLGAAGMQDGAAAA